MPDVLETPKRDFIKFSTNAIFTEAQDVRFWRALGKSEEFATYFAEFFK